MQLTNTTLAQSVTLSHDLVWADEHSYSATVGTNTYTITGALLIEIGTKQAGRTITLQAPDDSMAWHSRVLVETLRVWAGLTDQEYTLTLDDARSFSVQFNHANAPAVDASPVRGFPTYAADEEMHLSLKLIAV